MRNLGFSGFDCHVTLAIVRSAKSLKSCTVIFCLVSMGYCLFCSLQSERDKWHLLAVILMKS